MIEVLMMGAGAPMSTVGLWTQLALTGTKPSGRNDHTLVSVGDKLYLHGGNPGPTGDLWEYDTVNNVWLELNPSGTTPSGRYNHTLVNVEDKLYLHGGNPGGTTRLGDLWEYTVPE